MVATGRAGQTRRRGHRSLRCFAAAAALLGGTSLVRGTAGASELHPRASGTLTLHVTTLLDTSDVTPHTGPCADASGRCSVRAALQIADARQVPVVVHVPSGTYVVASALEVDDAGGVTIEGAAATSTTLSGGGAVPVLEVGDAESLSLGPSVAGVGLTATDLTIEDGASASVGAFQGDGGCAVVGSANASLTLASASVRHCSATENGGGIYSVGRLGLTHVRVLDDAAVDAGGGIDEVTGVLNMSGCTVDADTLTNTATEADGGGAYASGLSTIAATTFQGDQVAGDAAFGGGLDLLGTATLTHDTFEGDGVTPSDPAYDTDGAGLYAVGPVDISGSTFFHNTAFGRYAYGGGLSSEGGLVLSGSTLDANIAYGTAGGYGGGLYAEGGATVSGSLFDHNVVESAKQSYGGGLYVQDSTQVVSSTFHANTATNGDGAGLYAAGVGTFVDRSTFSRNHATGGELTTPGGPGYGGGLAAASSMRVRSSTIEGNAADQGGGGLYVAAAVELDSTLVSANTATEGAGVYDYWVLAGADDAIVDNVAAGAGAGGGGLFDVGFTGSGDVHSSDLAGSVLAGNVAPVGGGVEFQGGASGSGGGTFAADRVAGNRTASGRRSECSFVGTLALQPWSLGGNVIGDGSCDLRAPSDRPGPRAQGVWGATTAGGVVGREVATFGRLGHVAALAAGPGDTGYYAVAPSGSVRAFGTATVHGSAAGRLAGGVATGIATTLDRRGFWVVSSRGAVDAFGDAHGYGQALGAHVVAIAPSVDGRGYELLLADGTVRAFGDAPHLATPRRPGAVAIAMTPDGLGYWLLTRTGQVMTAGDARSYGGARLHALAILPTPDGGGYLLVGDDGAVLARGDAHSPGSLRGHLVAAATT